jgi:hypothetical protein
MGAGLNEEEEQGLSGRSAAPSCSPPPIAASLVARRDFAGVRRGLSRSTLLSDGFLAFFL